MNYWFKNTEWLLRAKTKQDKKKRGGGEGGGISLVLCETSCFPCRKKAEHENRMLTQQQRWLASPRVKRHVPWWAVNLPCHYPSSILTNMRFLPMYTSGQTKELWSWGCLLLMWIKQRLLLFKFLVTMKSNLENEHFALDLKQRWEPPPHRHLI